MPTTQPSPEAEPQRHSPVRVHWAVTMLLSVAALVMTLGIWWIGYGAGLTPFPPFDLADRMIEVAPGEVAVWAIANLQFNAQKLALLGGILIWLAPGAIVGLLLRQRPDAVTGAVIGVALALVAVSLISANDDASKTVSGIWFALGLAGPLTLAGHWIERLQSAARDRQTDPEHWLNAPGDQSRRDVLQRALGSAFAFGFGGWLVGSLWRRSGTGDVATAAGQPLDQVRSSLEATPAAGGAPPVFPTPEPAAEDADDFDAPSGVRPVITSNEDFYTIDISTRDPVIPAEQWTLKVSGLVGQELEITYNDLLSMPSIELPGTLMCISFTYGSELISTTHWTGVRLRDVLQMAGISDGAVELVLKGAGGYSDSIQVAKALEATTLLAYGMNGETLPRGHGYPCRLYVPNIYGEKNVKWLEEIEVVDFEYTGFWQERGWDSMNTEAVINIISTIDTPLGEVAREASGSVPVGGVAFAGSRGIQSVQIQVDGGPWMETIAEPYEPELVWQRWRYDLPAEPGEHNLVVKAIDGEGNEQVAAENPPFPDGMTGLHKVQVQVL